MARNDAVWGIDIGQCSLKALRCRLGDSPDQIVAEAFDFIAYPKILSQPGANPEEPIQEALAQFLSRNNVRGCKVAISVSGQNGLARFIKLPPVESKKIPDIVRYEARQQIPFDLNDVVWDFQQMGGGAEEEGFVLETEIGLFAMKRDQVFRALKPFTTAGIEVDIVQLTPLALYNYVLFDQLNNLPPVEEYDPDNPPPSKVVISLGTDSTDLVITNGYRVWQRSIPIGGNHFTKALTKELKLTFAKAEHLKCNATTAKDPKALFQAMRPVFSDLLTEIQRSIAYFSSIDRNAKIEKVLALGGAMKMPGLRRYLSQSLGMEVVRADNFRGMSGPEVLGVPAFKDNLVSYAVCYGLVVQGLKAGRGVLCTNLLPREIVKDRFIRNKKPWIVAAAALLMLGFTIGYAGSSIALSTVEDPEFKNAETQCAGVAKRSSDLKAAAEQAKTDFESIDKIGQHLIGNVESRVVWLEMLHALNKCLPLDNEAEKPKPKTAAEREKAITESKLLHITSLQCQRLTQAEAAEWTTATAKWYTPSKEELAKNPELANPASPTDPAAAGVSGTEIPAGGEMSGEMGGEAAQSNVWLIQLDGYHYHNSPEASLSSGAQYVIETLIKNLQEMEVILPTGDKQKTDGGKQKTELVKMKELGISHPVLIEPGRWELVQVSDRDGEPEAAANAAVLNQNNRTGEMAGGAPTAGTVTPLKLRRFPFKLQFLWQPTPPTVRHENKLKQSQEQATATGDGS